MSTALSADGYAIDGARAHAGHFQPEIQGLRAIAVLAVIWAHAGLAGLPGGFTGVDIFFVISGFLITRLLLAEIERTGRVDLLAFWARRARRLLPNAYATLIGTLLLALFLFPGYNPGRLVSEITYAALEVVNFVFAANAVDYFQAESAISPVLHFWSLSVEEQFYLAWPLVLTGICLLGWARRKERIVWVLGLIWVASFTASLMLTVTEQPIAYFSTGTRCWQLATGAMLAASWQAVERLPLRFRVGLAWLGLAAIVLGLAATDETLRYPGAWALLPTLGTAALIAGFGAADTAGPLRRGLSLPVMQWIGERSYSWYLWHWPLLILPRSTFPDSPYVAALAIPASLAIACLAYSWLETPLRNSPALARAPLATLAGAAAGLGLIVVAGYAYLPALFLLNEPLAARMSKVEAAANDNSRPGRDKCHLGRKRIEQPDCLYGDVTAARRAVLLGDSHAAHWFEPINVAAKQAGWQLRSWTKSLCPAVDVPLHSSGAPYVACTQWRDAVMGRLTGADRPDLVIISNSTEYAARIYDPMTGALLDKPKAEAEWRDGMRRTLRRFLDAGASVAIIRDIPTAKADYRRCLIAGGPCTNPRDAAIAEPPLDAQLMREFGGRVMVLDFTDEICDGAVCPAMRNGVIVYRDTTHLTATYAATFAPHMTRLLASLRDKVFDAPTAALGQPKAVSSLP